LDAQRQPISLISTVFWYYHNGLPGLLVKAYRPRTGNR
jgi:hypothetical protein